MASKKTADKPPAKPTPDSSDPNIGVYVGKGVTYYGTEGGGYVVDPDTGCITARA